MYISGFVGDRISNTCVFTDYADSELMSVWITILILGTCACLVNGACVSLSRILACIMVYRERGARRLIDQLDI